MKRYRYIIEIDIMSSVYVKNRKPSTLIRKEKPPPPLKMSKASLDKFVGVYAAVVRKESVRN